MLITKKKPLPISAQETIPMDKMYKDGICKVKSGYYTKTVRFNDINYFQNLYFDYIFDFYFNRIPNIKYINAS